MSSKRKLRRHLSEKRAALNRHQVEQASQAMLMLWKEHFPLGNGGYLHLFQSIRSRNEVETSFFINWVRRHHPETQLVIPVVEGDRLRHALMTPELPMKLSPWGILEPAGPFTDVEPAQIDMVLVPMLGFNEERYRLGYGKGFYDGFLSQVRGQKLGLCFSLGLVSELPVEPHDVALDWIITEHGVV